MPVPSIIELSRIAQELMGPKGCAAFLARFLERDEPLAVNAQQYLLGIIDADVENEDLSNELAESYYSRLGFSADEAAEIRQQAASLDYQQGRDIKKKLS